MRGAILRIMLERKWHNQKDEFIASVHETRGFLHEDVSALSTRVYYID